MPPIGCGPFGEEDEGCDPDPPGNQEQLLRSDLETPPQWSQKVD